MATKPIESPGATAPKAPPAPDIRTAYEIHTLAQMLYGHLAAPPHWAAPPPVHAPWSMQGSAPMPPFGSWPHN